MDLGRTVVEGSMHFRTLEVWRLAAAVTVMMWHFLRYSPPGHEAASNALYRLMPLMEMFFMISGFLIMLRYADGRDGLGSLFRGADEQLSQCPFGRGKAQSWPAPRRLSGLQATTGAKLADFLAKTDASAARPMAYRRMVY